MKIKRNFLSIFLMLSFFSMPGFSMPNYIHTTTYQNSYQPYNNYYKEEYYDNYNQPINNYNSMPCSQNQVIVETHQDTRENIDKNIDRFGKIVLIASGAALVGSMIGLAFSR